MKKRKERGETLPPTKMLPALFLRQASIAPLIEAKRKTPGADGVDEANGAARLDTAGLDSLNVNGVATFPLPNKINTAKFVAELRTCCNKWFHHNLRKMLTTPPNVPTMPSESKRSWEALSPAQQQYYINMIDLRTDEGMRIVFDSEYLPKQSWWIGMGGGRKFFRKAVTYVKMGNSALAQGPIYDAWTASGFGFWAHLIPNIGLELVMAVMEWMPTLGFVPGLPEHFPHVIYKPPGGKALDAHHDQMAPRELIDNLKIHLASSDPSTTAWVKKHGCQMLAHFLGGTGKDDGATFVVGPMPPTKLLFCLQNYASGRVEALTAQFEKQREDEAIAAGKAPQKGKKGDDAGDEGARWAKQTKDDGIIKLNWQRHLEAFNRLLLEANYDSIDLIPAAPQTRDNKGFILMFPVGWPHGSFTNVKKEDVANYKGSRITVTVPITVSGSSQEANSRIPDRLRNLMVLSNGGYTKKDYAEAEIFLRADTKPYADGLTHTKPQSVLKFVRHPDALLISGEIATKAIEMIDAATAMATKSGAKKAVDWLQLQRDQIENMEIIKNGKNLSAAVQNKLDLELLKFLQAITAAKEALGYVREEGPFYPISIQRQTLGAYNQLLRGLAAGSSSGSTSNALPLPSPDVGAGSSSNNSPEEEEEAAPTEKESSDEEEEAAPTEKESSDEEEAENQNVPMDVVDPGLAKEVPPVDPGLAKEAPPTLQDLLDQNVQIVKVQQPWANLLAIGIKNVENRSMILGGEGKKARFMILASSRGPQPPSTADMADAKRRLELEGNTMALNPMEYKYGHILGVLRIDGYYSEDIGKPLPRPSVWYNPPDIGWFIGKAWEFEDPIPFLPTTIDTTQTKFGINLDRKFMKIYRRRIGEELEKLRSND